MEDSKFLSICQLKVLSMIVLMTVITDNEDTSIIAAVVDTAQIEVDYTFNWLAITCTFGDGIAAIPIKIPIILKLFAIFF